VHRATGEGWLCPAVFLDPFSRQVMGWARSAGMGTAPIVDALDREGLVPPSWPRLVLVRFDRGNGCCSKSGGLKTLFGPMYRLSMS
jgi:hypothetical protein